MRRVFDDTFCGIALLNPRDQAHEQAVGVSKGLGPAWIVTTEAVLTEFLNCFGARGSLIRGAAAKLVEWMQADRSVQVVPQAHEDFLAGCRLYRARPDKTHSLTDCISMEVMRSEGLNEVLTNDEHFTQEGFTCLLGS